MKGFCERFAVTIAATTGWQPSELGLMRPARLVRYAVTSLELEAERLVREVQLFTIPVEAYGSEYQPIRKSLHALARQWMAIERTNEELLNDQEREAEREYTESVEAAILARDEARLEQIELDWTARIEARNRAGADSPLVSEIHGNLSILDRWVAVN